MSLQATAPIVDSKGTRSSTRAMFFIAGFSMGLWASLVPYAQHRLEFDAGLLGALLLCLGAGSLLTMLFAGRLIGYFGCRTVVLCGIALVCLFLPTLAVVDEIYLMGLCLFFFGAGIGLTDVAANVQGSWVEQSAGQPLMSGFHGCYSLGSIAGAGGGSLLYSLGLLPPAVTLVVVATVLLTTLAIYRNLLVSAELNDPSPSAATPTRKPRPNGRLILMALMCMICFMAEGAILDWSGVFLTAERGLEIAHGGWGFAVFGITMSVMRFTGDRTVSGLGRKRVLVLGSWLALLGYALAIVVPHWLISLFGFALVGMGAANIVPVLITLASQEKVMPVNMSVALVATLGYLGVLAGPALIGFIAHLTSIYWAFSLVALLFMVIILRAGRLHYSSDAQTDTAPVSLETKATELS